MPFTRRQLIASAAAATAMCSVPPVFASSKSVKIAVGGKALYYYLPISIAESLGYFKDEGLDVPNSRPTRSLTIEVAREFFYSQQIQQITVSFGYGTNDESVCRTVLSCLYAA